MLRDLALDYVRRLVTLSGSPVPLATIEYRMLAELAANAGRVLTYERLLQRVWGSENSGDVRPMRTVVSALRRELGDARTSPGTSSPSLSWATGWRRERPRSRRGNDRTRSGLAATTAARLAAPIGRRIKSYPETGAIAYGPINHC